MASENQIEVIAKVYTYYDKKNWRPFIDWAPENISSRDASRLVSKVIGKAWNDPENKELFREVRQEIVALGFKSLCSTCEKPRDPANSTETCSC